METIKQSFRDRFAHPQYLAVELIILVAAVYNFTVTARFQGWESLDPTVKQGAVVFALIIDGGLFTSLFLMRDAHFREQEKRAKTWRNWAILFGGITCLMALLFNGSHWHPDPVSATSWVGTLLSWIETSGTALVLKSVGPIVALYPLAHYAPVKGQSLADVQTEADKMVAREEALTRVHELRQKRDPKQALREAKEAERRLLVRLRAELVRAGVSHPERKTDDWVRIKAAALGIYDPASDTVTEYKPKPMAPFNQVLEIALAHGLVSDEEVEEASYNSGPARTEWQNEVRERVENAGLTPEVVEPKPDYNEAALEVAPQEAAGLEAAPLSQGAESAPSMSNGSTSPGLPAVGGVDLAAIPKKRAYNPTEAARLCGIARSTLMYWINQKKLDCHRPRGKSPWFDYDQLLAAIEKTEPERQLRVQIRTSMQFVQPASQDAADAEAEVEEAVAGN